MNDPTKGQQSKSSSSSSALFSKRSANVPAEPTKPDKERLKREDEERKRKLQEIYRKQRTAHTSEQLITRSKELPKLTGGSSSFSSASNPTSASISLLDHNKQQQQASNKFVYEQDISKILQDKITYLLSDNDKLVEKQRQQFINHNKRSKQQQQQQPPPPTSSNTVNQFVNNDLLDGLSQPDDENDYSDDDMDEIETIALRNLTNFDTNDTNKKQSTEHQSSQQQKQQHPYLSKNDKIKKICSIALSVQTKLEQTKLKLFGMNPNDDSIMYYGNNVNNMTEDDYDDGNVANAPSVVAKPSQIVRSKQAPITTVTTLSSNNSGGVTTVLTPNMAARRIQIAYRKYLNRRRRYLKKNQQHHINIIKYNNMSNEELKVNI